MPACCCSLAGTRACDTCQNGASQYRGFFINIPIQENPMWEWTTATPKKIIEKFDKDGNLIERITEG